MIIDRGAKKDCYAIMWSYGEICVGCGCCAEDPVTRLTARIAYHEYCLKEDKNFNGWYDDPGIRAIQEKNVKANIEYNHRMIQTYKDELKKLEESDGHE